MIELIRLLLRMKGLEVLSEQLILQGLVDQPEFALALHGCAHYHHLPTLYDALAAATSASGACHAVHADTAVYDGKSRRYRRVGEC